MITFSIVVPVYNEVNTIHEILSRISNSKLDKKEVIIVDDGSIDGTRDQLEKYKNDQSTIRIIYHDINKGKGAALRTGFNAASGDIIIIQDADLEYDPIDYPKLIEPIIEGKADVVYGSRFMGGPHRVLYFWHSVGNKFLTLLSNALTNLNLTDMETCYKVFKRDVLRKIILKSNRFGFEPEFTAKVAKNGFRIYEVPISYNGRNYSEGKKITWKDGFVALFMIVRFRLFD
jgi:glycosyltransferase involved in cell wall biosynthesis